MEYPMQNVIRLLASSTLITINLIFPPPCLCHVGHAGLARKIVTLLMSIAIYGHKVRKA